MKITDYGTITVYTYESSQIPHLFLAEFKTYHIPLKDLPPTTVTYAYFKHGTLSNRQLFTDYATLITKPAKFAASAKLNQLINQLFP